MKKLFYPTVMILLIRSLVKGNPFEFATSTAANIAEALKKLWITIDALDTVARSEKKRLLTTDQRDQMRTYSDEYQRLKLANVLAVEARQIEARGSASPREMADVHYRLTGRRNAIQRLPNKEYLDTNPAPFEGATRPASTLMMLLTNNAPFSNKTDELD